MFRIPFRTVEMTRTSRYVIPSLQFVTSTSIAFEYAVVVDDYMDFVTLHWAWNDQNDFSIQNAIYKRNYPVREKGEERLVLEKILKDCPYLTLKSLYVAIKSLPQGELFEADADNIAARFMPRISPPDVILKHYTEGLSLSARLLFCLKYCMCDSTEQSVSP